MPLLSITEYARSRHCHINAVHYAVRNGRIHLTDEGLVDQEVADREWAEKSLPSNRTAAATAPKVETLDSDATTFAAARAQKEAAIAKMRELDYQVRIGVLGDVREFERKAFTFYRGLRDAAFNIPDRIAATLAGEGDAETIRRMLRDELEEVFTSFAAEEKTA